MHNTQKFHFSTFIVVCNIPVLIVFNDSSWNKVNVTIHSLIVCYNNSNFLNGSVTFLYLTYYRIIVIFILRKVTVSLLIIDYYFRWQRNRQRIHYLIVKKCIRLVIIQLRKLRKSTIICWNDFISSLPLNTSSYNLCA